MGQAIDNLIMLERIKKPGIDNISKLTLDVARSKLAKPGYLYLEYDPKTTMFQETEPEAVEEPQQDEVEYRRTPYWTGVTQTLGRNN